MKAVLKYYVITHPGTYISFRSKLFKTKQEAENWVTELKQKLSKEFPYKILAKEMM